MNFAYSENAVTVRAALGSILRSRREANRRTLSDVAAEAGLSPAHLSEVERGRKEASSEVLAAVCDALRIELSDLLAEVRRDLVRDRAPVLRLDAARRRHDAVSPPVGRRPGDVLLLAA